MIIDGKTIKRLRLRKKIGIEELAKKAELSRQTISCFESGRCGISLRNFKKVCKALGLKLEIV